jgi:hypothetical protein
MSGSRRQALVDARKLLRTFAAAPDARRCAQAIMSELRRADGWSPEEHRAIEAVDAWIRTLPPVSDGAPKG